MIISVNEINQKFSNLSQDTIHHPVGGGGADAVAGADIALL